MTPDITDETLERLLSGSLTPAEESELESRLVADAALRTRFERLSGAEHWPAGSAPIPHAIQSARLSGAIQAADRFAAHEARRTFSSASQVPLTEHDPGDESLPIIPGIALQRSIGKGGMGRVYEGIDEALGRRVAVKLLNPGQASNRDAADRLLKEAQSAAVLQHDNIVTVYSIAFADCGPALIQQYIDGESLQEKVDREGPLPIDECVRIADQVASGLAAAHAAGLVHRDLKPSNILIERATGRTCIADFGLALRHTTEQQSSAQIVIGTPAFMSPEQAAGKTVDARSDLFSLGSVLYVCLTGRPPFDGDDPYAVIDAVQNQIPVAVRERRVDCPRLLASILEKLMSKDAARRFQSADELIVALRRLRPSSMRRRGRVIAAALSAMLCVGLAVWGTRPSQNLNRAVMLASDQAKSEQAQLHIRNTRTQETYADLQSAVASAASGDTILIDADLESQQVDIVKKALIIEGVGESRPIIRPTAWAKEHHPYLFRTDSDLTIKNLMIDWQVIEQTPQLAPGKLTAAIASMDIHSQLTIEDCVVNRSPLGISIGAAGDLNVLRSRIGGGDYAVMWLAQENHMSLDRSLLSSPTAIVILYPSASENVEQASTILSKHVTFQGTALIDLLLTRPQETLLEFEAEHCDFDLQRMVQITASTSLNANLNWDIVSQRILKQTLAWRENQCRHVSDIQYLASRRIKQWDKWMNCGVKGLNGWSEFWKRDGDPVVSAAVEWNDPSRPEHEISPTWKAPEIRETE